MYYDKKKYEQLILESPLFSLDKESEYTAFKRESYRMIEYLYCYLLSINEKEYEPYGCEITEVATRCISNYDSSKGVFLHYFNSAWKQEYSHILGEKIHENIYQGIRITEDDQRAVRKYIRLADQLGTDCKAEELYHKLSEAMNLPISRVEALAQMSRLTVCGDSFLSNDGAKQILWDQIPGNASASQHIESEEEIEAILEKVDEAFNSLQARQKPVVSDMITIKICPFLTKSQARRFSFISDPVIEEWIKCGTVPTQRDIAKKYGRDEASVSRTLKCFLKKLMKDMGDANGRDG